MMILLIQDSSIGELRSSLLMCSSRCFRCSNAGSGGTEGMKRFRAVSLLMRGSKRAQNCCNGPSWTYMTRVPSVPQRSLAIMALYSMSWLTKVPRKTLRAPGAPTCAKPPQGIDYAVILCFPVSLCANSWNRMLSHPNNHLTALPLDAMTCRSGCLQKHMKERGTAPVILPPAFQPP